MKEVLHQPVLPKEVLSCLDPKQGGRYLDLTAGFGGHASLMKKYVGPSGQLTLVDRDEMAIAHLQSKFGDNKNCRIIRSDFLSSSENLLAKSQEFDYILADIGVSSYQLDDADRGFSFSKDAPLDMRMDRTGSKSAYEVINNYNADELTKIFKLYGELSNTQARLLATKIIEARPVDSTIRLAEISRSIPHDPRKKIQAQIFQAVRIEVNQELLQLEKALPVWLKLLARGGKIAVITFHSLEDRIVKRFFAENSKNKYQASLELLNKKPITASNNEIVHNPRARSAKLRAAVKK